MSGRRSSAPAAGDASRCAWPRCPQHTPASRLMCRPHWSMLPKPLRDAILAHYRPGQNALSCSPEYREALRAVLAWARERQAGTERQAEREALMTRLQGTLW